MGPRRLLELENDHRVLLRSGLEAGPMDMDPAVHVPSRGVSTSTSTSTCPACASTYRTSPTTSSLKPFIQPTQSHPIDPTHPQRTSQAHFRTQTQLRHTLSDLIESYQALNSRTVPELRTPPRALEFCREFVGVNRPVVVRASKGEGKEGRGGGEMEALGKWVRNYLVKRMEGRKVEVAVSPNGKADSIILNPQDGKEYFVEPAAVQMDLETLFQHLNTPSNTSTASDSDSDKSTTAPAVYYLQSQNGNLQPNQDLEPLLTDVGERGPRWAREAFGSDPDAVNIWIGDERSSTSVHKDPYENIYLVIRGTKTFTLYPPTEFVCLKERTYPHASYTFDLKNGKFEIIPTEGFKIPWLSVIPFSTNMTKFTFTTGGSEEKSRVEDLFHSESESEFEAHFFEEKKKEKRMRNNNMKDLATPLTVTLEEGDYLYLPSLWFHAVRQEGRRAKRRRRRGKSLSSVDDDDEASPRDDDDDDRAVIAVNWWYDMKMHGPGWSMNEFLREVSRIAVSSEEEKEEEEE
ncbi:BQ2448_3824 [Microbotryum intermedium]|uniref:BQ2448_3824 protein n=1 Tax=Microbotryum intermedium TaxID=269621 RepID=A0A238FB35_9BASI|nr:BQ2448_3824 [Microbotryum intermedium]